VDLNFTLNVLRVEHSVAVSSNMLLCGAVCREIQSRMMMSQSCEDLSLVIVIPPFLSDSVFCLMNSNIKMILYTMDICTNRCTVFLNRLIGCKIDIAIKLTLFLTFMIQIDISTSTDVFLRNVLTLFHEVSFW